MQEFPAVQPGESDNFTFDFTDVVGAAAITAAQWSCTVSLDSSAADPNPASRLIGAPTFDTFTTTQRFGNAVAGAVYQLEATVTLSDGRVLADQAEVACQSVPLPVDLPTVGGWAQFDYDTWLALYPEFHGISSLQAQGYWNQATLFHKNDGTGPVTDLGQQTTLLYLLTAHLAALHGHHHGGPGLNRVGRITSSSVGGVSLSRTFDVPPGSAQWYAQTSYGVAYWTATSAYRTMHYFPATWNHRRIFNRWPL